MESGIKLPFTKKPCFVVSHRHLSGVLYGIHEKEKEGQTTTHAHPQTAMTMATVMTRITIYSQHCAIRYNARDVFIVIFEEK